MATALFPNLNPGDMLGFSGRGFVANMINLGSLGIPHRGLSHVAIVGTHSGDLCLYESTTLVNLPCLERGEPVSGVQCHPIEDRVRTFDGRVWHYPLILRPTLAECLGLEHRMRKLCQSRCPYDYMGAWRSRSMLIALAVRAKFGRENLRELFCSELVAYEWETLGILDTDNASKWNPNSLARYAVRHKIVRQPAEITLPEESVPEAAGEVT